MAGELEGKKLKVNFKFNNKVHAMHETVLVLVREKEKAGGEVKESDVI